MLINNWCPSHIRRLVAAQRLEHFRLLANIHPLRADLDHASCWDSPSCAAFARLTGDGKPKHVKESCKCSDISVDYSELISILKTGALVVIDVIETEGSDVETAQELTLKIRKRTLEDKYVAISHVWSDGLGNSDQNSIPNCQLSRLLENVRELIPETRSAQKNTVVSWFTSSIRHA